ncbi:hypothetical protein Bsp3421_000139 (plasmid) [Burkholderia sp. FERM BP-3421]|nr:hypothetical protein Bsp3421_000139 [Burkholderia sp. FERM BP-3421]
MPPAPRCADGIVFHIAQRQGHSLLWTETIGIAFEHRGRTWAVHRSMASDPNTPALFSVSDIETGRSLLDIQEFSIDTARAAAIQMIDAVAPAQWDEFFPAPQSAKPRRRAPVSVT